MARTTSPAHAPHMALTVKSAKTMLFTLLSTSFLIAISAYPTSARAQNNPKSGTVCIAAQDATHHHLQGLWKAHFYLEPSTEKTGAGATELPPTATLQLGPHPELAQSVRGTVQRDGVTAQVSGDVEEGDVTLEESINGTNISATWTGRVSEGSCGKEINGIWNNANPTPNSASVAPIRFVLRKQPSWQ